MLTLLLDTCLPDFGTLICDSSSHSGATVLADTSKCSVTAGAINSVIKEYRGPAGDEENVDCAFDDFLYDNSGCEATVATLNSAVEAYQDGSFRNCQITTPTTTKTTTLTSSQTTTQTTTRTTSKTTTKTTTLTVSPTTSLTTSMTTSQTTTPFAGGLECVKQHQSDFLGGATCSDDAAQLTRFVPRMSMTIASTIAQPACVPLCLYCTCAGAGAGAGARCLSSWPSPHCRAHERPSTSTLQPSLLRNTYNTHTHTHTRTHIHTYTHTHVMLCYAALCYSIVYYVMVCYVML